MAIANLFIRNNFRAFIDEFEVGFCPGVNVLIGDNGTGKTTLLKGMYANMKDLARARIIIFSEGSDEFIVKMPEHYIGVFCRFSSEPKQGVYIPEKDILEHAKGLLPFIEQKHTGFDEIYKDVLISAQDVPTTVQSEMQRSIGNHISKIIDGIVEWDQGDGTFYMIRTDGSRIPFSHEASAYKKLGYLGLLVSCGRLEPGTILFWDEPENSLNPEIMPRLVRILLELAQSGVQIFIATHSYDLARYFDIRKDKDIPVLFHNLVKKQGGGIVCHSSPEYVKLPDNHMEKASEKLFKAVVTDALEVQGNE